MARRLAALLVISLLLALPAAAQNDEIALTALRSREALVRAMNQASAGLGASAAGTVAGDTWRSGLLASHHTMRSGGNIVDVGYTATIMGTLHGNPPDSVRVLFRAQVTGTVPFSSRDKSDIARILLAQMAMATNVSLSADHSP